MGARLKPPYEEGYTDGVAETLDKLRPLLARIPRTLEGGLYCLACGQISHSEYCPWPQIDELLGVKDA
jgi:hypothetical protein